MSGIREQALTALERAQEIRLARAELRHKIAAGEIFAASVLLDPPSEARSWPVEGLLTSQHRWGKKRTGKLLRVHQIPERKPVGQLTERQRRLLAKALGDRQSGAVDESALEGER